MRSAFILSAALVTVAQTAGAIACNYSGQGIVAEALPAALCWDLAAWPEAQAKAFCENKPMTDRQIGSQPIARCPAGAVAKCVGSPYKIDMDESVIAEEDYAKMPPAIAEHIRAQLAEMNAEVFKLKSYEGNVTTLYYYPDVRGYWTIARQQRDCLTRGGQWQ
jgi:hypothetical protein